MKSNAKKKVAPKPMPKPAARRGLGKGLSALMSEAYTHTPPKSAETTQETVVQIVPAKNTLKLSQIDPGSFQPRGYFNEAALAELASSIRQNGVMQPILVREKDNGRFEIIAGERRFRAAGMAGLAEIPALIRELSDSEALEFALIENVQRENLHPLEEATGYQRLMNEFTYTQEEVAGKVGKSRSHVANFLRLLDLPKEVREIFSENRITAGHARALLMSEIAGILVQEVVEKGLSVRQTEKLVRSNNMLHFPDAVRKTRARANQQPEAPIQSFPPAAGQPYARPKDPDILALEETLSENLGLKVSISDRGQSGEISIAYESLEQLDEILRRLGGSI